MQSQKNNSSGVPFLIIGVVFLIVFIGGWWVYSSRSRPKPVSSGSNTAQTPNNVYENASPGAQPPHMLGSPAAAVTVEEFADYQCPTCATVHTLMKQITTEYNARIKFIFRVFPLVQIHDKAYDAAVAAEAAGFQGKYWDMQNLLFVNQSNWSASPDHRKLFIGYATQIGLDVEKFQTDLLGLPAKSRVNSDLERARSLRVSSTPTIYVNGMQVPSTQFNADSLRKVIDAELQKAEAKNQPANGNQGKPAENK